MDRPNEIPTLAKYVEGGGKPEQYPEALKRLQAEHEAFAMEQAKLKAKRTIRVRVTGKNWPPKQTHYKVLAKAPFDPRIKKGEPGYEHPYKNEPPLSLPIGKVSEVPVRDERHLAMLVADPILEVVPDHMPTHQEEQAEVDAAIDQVRRRGTTPPAQPPVPEVPQNIFQLKEPDALELIKHTTDLVELADWHEAAEKRGSKVLAQAILSQLMDLHSRLSQLLDQLMPVTKLATPVAPTKPEGQGATAAPVPAGTTGTPAQAELITPSAPVPAAPTKPEGQGKSDKKGEKDRSARS